MVFRSLRMDWADIRNSSVRGVSQALVNETQSSNDDQNDSDDGFAAQRHLQFVNATNEGLGFAVSHSKELYGTSVRSG